MHLYSEKTKAIVLLSGGLDSVTLLAYVKSLEREVHAITFDYGQRHKLEIESAKKAALSFRVKNHLLIHLNSSGLLASALTSDETIPQMRVLSEIIREIPTTYVPARNIIFLSYALALSENIHANEIYIGINYFDHFGYPDCSKEFLHAFQVMANIGTKRGATKNGDIQIIAPFIQLSKSQIISIGLKLGVDYSVTVTCYSPTEEGWACGVCDGCIIRKKGFEDIGVDDPINYIR